MNFRGLDIPYRSFGNVSTNDLFGLKEQAIFDFYEANGWRYRIAADIGANVGVHSILMARAGWLVLAYEPDPELYRDLLKHADLNGVTFLSCQAAVSDQDGHRDFVRVKGNMTGSHLQGYKTPYGDIETFAVRVMAARRILPHVQFAKIDAEGAEADILCSVHRIPDCMVEVGNERNAERIYQHCADLRLGMWTQRSDWQRVIRLEDMPTHHSHGSLFIGRRGPF